MIQLSEPFRIGLSPLSEADWLSLDERLPERRRLRRRLVATRLQDIYQCVPGAEAAEARVAALIDQWLQRYPDVAPTDPDRALDPGEIGRLTEARYESDLPDEQASTQSALVSAALRINEDLLVLERDDEGWRLVSAFVAFPSRWRLSSKIGKLLDHIHDPVPDYAAGTRNATLLTGMFDRLREGQIVRRSNWSLHDSDVLFQDGSERHGRLRDCTVEQLWLRREIQSLRRLPADNLMVFTVDTRFNRLHELDMDQQSTVHDAIALLDSRQLAYKGW